MNEDAVRGISWTMLAFASTKVVRAATTVVLARLLVPDDFGLFALASLGIALLSVFNGNWIGATLIVRGDMDDRARGTVLTLLIAAGAAAAASLIAVAPILAAAFHEPRLEGILFVLGGILLFSGVNWFYETIIRRELLFRRRFAVQIIRTVVFTTTALVLAVLGAGVWSLVGAHVMGHVVSGVALFVLAPYRVRPAFERERARDIIRGNRGFLGQELSEFFQQNIDYLTVGQFLGATQLGYYSMAYRQAELPYSAIADPVGTVTFPAFARMRHEGKDVGPAFLTALGLVCLLTCPLGIIISAGARPFVEVLFGPQWHAMIAPLTVMGIWAIARPVQATIGRLLNSLGAAWLYGRISTVGLLPLAGATVLAADQGDITAVSWVLLAYILVVGALLVRVVDRHAGVSVRRQWRVLWPLFLASTISWPVTRAMAELAEAWPPVLWLGATIAGCLFAYVGTLAVVDRDVLTRAFDQAKRAVSFRRGARGAGPRSPTSVHSARWPVEP